MRGKLSPKFPEIRGTEPAETLMDLIRDAEAMRAAGEKGVESIIATSMDERDIERLMAWRHTNICTDGQLDGAHPRGYGTYPRVLGRYVRERDALTLPDAVHKSTALAAEHMGFADRGRIEPGFKADLVLFDPDAVIDRATPQDPSLRGYRQSLGERRARLFRRPHDGRASGTGSEKRVSRRLFLQRNPQEIDRCISGIVGLVALYRAESVATQKEKGRRPYGLRPNRAPFAGP